MTASVIVGICALAVSAIACYTTLRRNNKRDDKEDSSQMTTVIVKLENINEGVKDIKKDMAEIRSDVRDHGERIVRLETAVFGGKEK